MFTLQWLCQGLHPGVRTSGSCLCAPRLVRGFVQTRTGMGPRAGKPPAPGPRPPLRLAPPLATTLSADPVNRKLIGPDSPLVNWGWDSALSWLLAREYLRPCRRYHHPEVVSSPRPQLCRLGPLARGQPSPCAAELTPCLVQQICAPAFCLLLVLQGPQSRVVEALAGRWGCVGLVPRRGGEETEWR